MKTLLLKNCSIVYLSYLLDHISKEDSEGHITVLAHQHAVDNVQSLSHVNQVVPYYSSSLLEYDEVTAEERAVLDGAGFDQVCFFIEPGQKGGFENLLTIARKLVSDGGQVVGITLQGEEIHFPRWKIRQIQLKLWLRNLASLLVLTGFIVVSPWLLFLSLFKQGKGE